ncbi:MAG: hypothetical protein MJ183_05100 [Treponemataceae bacterium]|nr:hypothetical protein [Treponemataceae bacterium]
MSLSSVTMPSVTMPQISVSGTPADNGAGTGDRNKSSGVSGNASSVSATAYGTMLTAQTLLGLGSSDSDTLSSMLGYGSAASQVSDPSALSSIYSLSGLTGSNVTDLLGNSSSSNYANNILLSEIITKLDALTKQIQELSGEETASVQRESADKNGNSPGIRRLIYNGYNLLDTVTDVFVSKPESDGSFLLIADRTYTADRRQRTENVYMLFDGSENQVSVQVVQDSENVNSAFYKLAALSPAKYTRTGNSCLICITKPGSAWTFEMLVTTEE